MKHILSAAQFKTEELEEILARAEEMEEQCKSGQVRKLLENKIVASIFFEPSTRTRLSFETAALKLGAQIISVENGALNSSAFKGEVIEDTAQMLATYADVIVLRHPEIGSAERAAKSSSKPLINSGDGANQHPTQALLDLYTIKKEFGRLDNLSIAFVGDLIYSRPLHSLIPLLLHYSGNKFYFVSPKELELPEDLRGELQNQKIQFEETHNLEEILEKVDVLYMTRVQKERFANLSDYENVKDAYLLKLPHVKKMKEKSVIMHALPRVNEIDREIDKDPRAAYFRQAENGVYTRMALLLYALEL